MAINITEEVPELITKGETEKALELTRDYLTTQPGADKAYLNEVRLLLSKYNRFERRERAGLEPDQKDLHAVELRLLELIDDIKAGRRRTEYAAEPRRQTVAVQKKSSGSPILWVLSTVGVVVILLLLIGLAVEDPEEEVPTEQPVSTTPVETNFTSVTDNFISTNLANTKWFNEEYGYGYVFFDATGKTAAYAEGRGQIEVYSAPGDGFIYARFSNVDGSSGNIAFRAPIVGNQAQVFLQLPTNPTFFEIPMIWARR